jgi:hypothetical protein
MEIIEKIGRIDERVSEMHRALMGNGQPGKIAQIEKDIRALQKDHVAARGEMRGAYWVAGIVFTLGHAALMLYVHFHK